MFSLELLKDPRFRKLAMMGLTSAMAHSEELFSRNGNKSKKQGNGKRGRGGKRRRRRRGKRRRDNNGSSLAPVRSKQIGARTFTEFRGGRFTQVTNGNTTRVAGTEEIPLDPTGNILLILTGNPATWPEGAASRAGRQFMKYKPVGLRLTYVTAKGTDTDGMYTMGIMPFGASPTVAALPGALTGGGGVKTNLGNNATLDVDLNVWGDSWYNTKHSVSSSSMPFFMVVHTDTPASAAGSLVLTYTYDFTNPIDPATGSVTNLGLMSMNMTGTAIPKTTVNVNIGSYIVSHCTVDLGDATIHPGDLLVATALGASDVYWRITRGGVLLSETDLSGTIVGTVYSWVRTI